MIRTDFSLLFGLLHRPLLAFGETYLAVPLALVTEKPCAACGLLRQELVYEK